MRNKREIKTIIIVLGFFFTSSPIYSNIISLNTGNENGNLESDNELDTKISKDWKISAIDIDDLDPSRNWATTAASQPWCNGSGTVSDPYIIESVEIDGQNSGNCIEIRNSEVDFIIKNSKVYNAEGLNNAGIKLKNVVNGLLSNNNCSNNNANGIFLENCNDTTITHNIINNNGNPEQIIEPGVGIKLSNSLDNEITENSINDNYDFGISVVISHDNSFLDNYISNNKIGIIGYNCDNNSIIGNTLNANEEDGIQLFDCKENSILNNEIRNNGDRGVYLGSNCELSNLNHNNFIDNNINAEDEGSNNRWDNGASGNYWSDYTGVDADDDAIGDAPYFVSGIAGSQDNFPIWNDGVKRIIIDGTASGVGAHNWTWAKGRFWCSGSGNFSDPYIIEGVEIDGQNSGNCILIRNSHDIYFIISDCKVYNAGGTGNAGIKLLNVNNAQLIDNDCSNNNAHGILLMNCNNCTLMQNIANNNDESGIRLAESSHNKISKNIVENNKNLGICITFKSTLPPYADNGNEITENVVTSNYKSGIYLSFSIGANCSNNILYNNIYGGREGITLSTSHETIISGNVIDSYLNYGIALYFSWTNKIFNNKINKIKFCVAYDCSGIGVYVDELSAFNVLNNNSFTDNYINAKDEGVENKWDKDSIGNDWDDYKGIDDDDDGIGDTPYIKYGVNDSFPIYDDRFNGRPIYINGAATGVGAHNWTWARSRIWCTGSGSISDPYIIENLEIDGQNSENCIEIWNSDVYFIIRNCNLYKSGTGMYSAGISLGNVRNGKLINNIFSQNDICGIFLDECHDINITSNTIKQSGSYGIHSYNCKYCEISENIIIENHVGIRIFSGDHKDDHNFILKNEIRENDYGISLSYNNGLTFSNNIVNDNLMFGLELNYCTNNNFYFNLINNSGDGVILRSSYDNHFSRNIVNFNIDNGVYVSVVSENNTFYNNIFSNNDINANDEGEGNKWDNGIIGNYWSDYQGSDDDNDGIGDTAYQINVIDNFPIYENPRHHGEKIRIDGTGVKYRNWSQTALLKWWCRGSGTKSDPYVISNLIVNGQYYHSCILIMDSQDHFIIKNCKVFNSGLFYFGIKLEYVENGQLINNDCSDNIGAVIRLEHCYYNKISGNTINAIVQNVPIGISLSDSDNNEISDNIITNNYRGIVVSGDHNKFSNNKINNNVDGIYLTYGNDNFFSGNTINYNENDGMLLSNCDGNDFLNNILAFNGNYGIQSSSSCENNVLTENNFFRNNINALDDGFNNRWDNGMEIIGRGRGNYWDDYNGTDDDGDGIGDTPYDKHGVLDKYPIIKTGENKTLILVHGFNLFSKSELGWSKIEKKFKEYYDNIIPIVYYRNPDDMRDEEGNGVYITIDDRIQTVSRCLRNYIIDHHNEISDNVDFICHSMGGLVVRYMIKHYFDEIMLAYLNRGRLLRINHIAMLGTPNHGAFTARFCWATQCLQMSPDEWNLLNPFAPFLRRLNSPDETPYDNLIEWYTYSGAYPEIDAPDDRVVETCNVPLKGAVNRGPFLCEHTQLKKDSKVIAWLERDLDLVSPPVISTKEENIIVAPEPAPSIGTSTVNELKVELEAPDAILDPSSVTFNVNPEFEMNLVPGTLNTYEVDLRLPEGTHHYTISARDFHENSYTWEGEITISDDDTSYPYINFIQQYSIICDEKASEGILFEWDITDESGISEALVKLNGEIIRSYGPTDEISDSYLLTSNIPGIYTVEIWAKDNDNDPGHENDWLEFSNQYNITIFDDDIAPPSVSIGYSGLNLDSDPGIWDVEVMDKGEGIDEVKIIVDEIEVLYEESLGGVDSKSYNIPVPNDIETHEINVIVKDNDKDWDGDQGSNMKSSSVSIFDDDIAPPEIIIDYIGSGYDNDPGHFEWSVWDVDSGIDHVNITITYESTDGSDNYTISLVGTETGSWDLPPNLGNYTIRISARDNDDDRTLIIDSLTIELTQTLEMLDDDKDPPELSDLIIQHDIFEINISFTAIDYSGIGEIRIFVDDYLIEPIHQFRIGDTYNFTLNNQWLFKKAEVEIQVFDADDDRPNDSLMAIISGSFKNVLFEMYEYVDWQIEELKAYIEENLSHRKGRCLNWKLSKAQDYLAEAFILVENGKITCALYHDKMAKAFVQIVEFRNELYNKHFHNKHCNNKHCNNKHCHMSDEHTEYIIDTLHAIRNNIVILMGVSTGSEQAYDIAYLEVDLLNLSDFIEEEFSYCIGKYLSREVYSASKMLESAIFKIVMEEDIECILNRVQWKLERVIWKINWYLNKGRISEDLADYLIKETTRIMEAIE